MEYKDINLAQLGVIASEIAQTLTVGDIILLQGELGTGKTTFVILLCEQLKVKDIVNSPSYVLLNEYMGDLPIFHYDLYRLSSSEEAFELGILDRLTDGVTIIEWPNLIKNYLPKKRINIFLEHCGENRNISIDRV